MNISNERVLFNSNKNKEIKGLNTRPSARRGNVLKLKKIFFFLKEEHILKFKNYIISLIIITFIRVL